MYEYPFLSPLYLGLAGLYFLVASIVIFDTRLIQAKKRGEIHPELPRWISIFYMVQIVLFWSLFILNWKYALGLFVIKFILKVLPVLEIIGNILMRSFRPRDYWKKELEKEEELERARRELEEVIGVDPREVLANADPSKFLSEIQTNSEEHLKENDKSK